MSKDFTGEFDSLLGRLKSGENFAFVRFSDGEMFIMQNKQVTLAENHFVTGDRKGMGRYPAEEQKEFLPKEHQFYREKLIESLKFQKQNYFKGICCRQDVGEEDFQWQKELAGGSEDHLTFANLLINNNYKRFVEELVPILRDKEVLYVANEAADTDRLPFEVKEVFSIGSNCMIDDYHVVQEVKEYIEENKIENHVILCSAASLSNYIIHECYKDNSNNTFLDIGSCLNPYLGLEGWKYTRGYLTHYWLNSGSPYGSQIDTW